MRKQPYDLIVIGGGAAGMSAALTAAKRGLSVCLLDHMERLGKKILSTGNGRCNYTNSSLQPSCYYTHAPKEIEVFCRLHPTEEILAFMEEIGIPSACKEGYYYPSSFQAASVVECLESAMHRYGVKVVLGAEVVSLIKKKDRFVITGKEEIWEGYQLLLACGGKSAAHSGSDGSGYQWAETFGHRCYPQFPALVPLKIDKKKYRHLSGVRCQAAASGLVGEKSVREERGEVQFGEESLSGIVIFQLSHLIGEGLRQKKLCQVRLNLMPDKSKGEIYWYLQERLRLVGYKELSSFGIGMLPGKLWEYLVSESGIPSGQKAETLSKKEWERLSGLIGGLEIPILSTFGYDRAQVTAGGIDVNEINLKSMESRLCSGLYLAGEILDVDGICGGYNLHWAISGGITAGNSVKKVV